MSGNSISFSGDSSLPVSNKSGVNKNSSSSNPQNEYVKKLLQNKLTELENQRKAMRSEPTQNDSKKTAESFIAGKIEGINRLLSFQEVKGSIENKNVT